MTYGLDMDPADAEVLQNMAAHNYAAYSISNFDTYPTGAFTMLTNANVKSQLGRFYSHPSIRSSTTQVRISAPYVDAMGMGLMVTASKAVYDNNNILQGVVGYDITMEHLLNMLNDNDQFTEKFYPYLVDFKDGNALYHPQMPSPKADLAFLDPIHIETLEFNSQNPALESSDQELTPVEEIRTNSHSSFQQTKQVYKIQQKENGFTASMESSPDKNLSSARETIKSSCEKIALTDSDQAYIFCMVKYETRWTNGDEVELNLDAFSSAPSDFNYHNFTQKLRDSHDGSQLEKICSHGYRNSIFTNAAPVSVMKFSPRQFTKPLDYKIQDVADKDLMSSSGTPFKNFKEARASAYITESLDTMWKGQDAYYQDLFDQDMLNAAVFQLGIKESPIPMTVWRYFATTTGSIRVYPAINLADDYDPTKRPWFKLAMTDPGKVFILTPYVDAFGMGYVVTITKAIKITDDKDTVYGVLATDYFLGQMGNLFFAKLELCRQYPENCLLVDSTSAVIYWSDFNLFKSEAITVQDKTGQPLYIDQLYYHPVVNSPHATPMMPSYEDSIMHAFKPSSANSNGNEFWKESNYRTCQDANSHKTKYFMDLDVTFDLDSIQNGGCMNRGRGQICKLAGINAYLLNLGLIDPFQGQTSYVSIFPSLHFTENYEVIEQKFESENYDMCTNTLASKIGSVLKEYIPPCQGPSPSIDNEELLGKFLSLYTKQDYEEPGFAYENNLYSALSNIHKVPDSYNGRFSNQCFDWMTGFDQYATYPTEAYGEYDPRGGEGPHFNAFFVMWIVFVGFIALVGKASSSSSSNSS